jgi:Smg protein
MKENVVDVLIYLFENYMDSEAEMPANWESLQEELLEAGFHQGEVDKAFDWLQGLANQSNALEHSRGQERSLRVFTSEEEKRLDTECRGFLLSLEHGGILNLRTRELVIERLLALDTEEITLEELKWVVLMVLFNQPGQEEAFALMENLVYGHQPMYLH